MFSQIADRINSFRTYHRHLAQLRAMDDRQLADIGVSRGSITEAVRNGRR